MEVVEYRVQQGHILQEAQPLRHVPLAPLENMAALLPQRALRVQGHVRRAISAPQAHQESTVAQLLRRQLLRLHAPQEHILQGAQYPLLTVPPVLREHMGALQPQ